MSASNLAFLQKLTEELNLRDKLLIESENYYRQLINTIQEGIVEIDKDFKIIFNNPAFASLLGYDFSELNGKLIYDLFDEPQGEIVKNYFLADDLIRNEIKFLNKNGKEIWAFVSISFYFDNEKNFDGALLCITDINEKKLKSVKLINKMKIIDKFFDEIPLGIIIFKTDDSILYYNDKAEDILEIDLSKNVIIKNFPKILNYKDSKTGKIFIKNDDRHLSKGLNGKASHGKNLQITTKNNKQKILEYWSTPIFDDLKAVEFIIAVFTDKNKN